MLAQSGDSSVTIVLDTAAVVDSYPVFPLPASMDSRGGLRHYSAWLRVLLPRQLAQRYPYASWHLGPDSGTVVIILSAGLGGVDINARVGGDTLVAVVRHFSDYGPPQQVPGYQVLRRAPCPALSN